MKTCVTSTESNMMKSLNEYWQFIEVVSYSARSYVAQDKWKKKKGYYQIYLKKKKKKTIVEL